MRHVLGLVLALLAALPAAACLLGGAVPGASTVQVVLATVLLLAAPPLGLALTAGPKAFAPTLLGWSLALLWAYPVFGHRERIEALSKGLDLFPTPVLDPTALAHAVEAALPPAPERAPELSSTPVADAGSRPEWKTEGLSAEEAIAWFEAGGGAGTVLLPFEQEDQALLVPVALHDTDGEPKPVKMIFDTGATLTTLNRETVEQLGIEIPSDAPVIEFETAGGQRRAPIVLLERLELEHVVVEDVTVGLCEPCAIAGAVGLLGLNVSRRFETTVKHRDEVIELDPDRGLAADRVPDILPWLELELSGLRHQTGRVALTVQVKNRSPREIRGLRLVMDCEVPQKLQFGAVAAGATTERTTMVPKGANCDEAVIRPVGGAW